MNGAESLISTAVAAGVKVCFANPGTTEMPLVQALDAVPGLRPVLGLFEGVCTGAADGYGRMTGRPAMTLLHLGPGFANGIANLHNARRARTPILNVIGDHASWHLAADAPLTSDIESLARPVSGWVRSCRGAGDVAADTAEGLAAAASGQVATFVVPADAQWDPAADAGASPPPLAAGVPDLEPTDLALAPLADALRAPGAALLLGSAGLTAPALRSAGLIAAATGCRLMGETFPARQDRGGGLPDVVKLPYFPEAAEQALDGAPTLVLAGAPAPVAFFGYPGGRSSVVPEKTEVLVLAKPASPAAPGPVLAALDALAAHVAGSSGNDAETRDPQDRPTSSGADQALSRGEPVSLVPGSTAGPRLPADLSARLDPTLVGAVLAALQPEGAVVVDEAATTGLPWQLASGSAAPHTVLSLTGGAIGQGLPCAVGAAVACPDRPVIAFQADGSGLYTAQALWTMARERLDVTVLLCNNAAYRILQVELHRAGTSTPGAAGRGLTDLGNPALDWQRLSEGFGVPASRATTGQELADQLRAALSEPGPHLIEMML